MGLMDQFTAIFAPTLCFSLHVRMPSISKTDCCANRSIHALLNSYQGYLVTKISGDVGGAVASWLVRSTPDPCGPGSSPGRGHSVLAQDTLKLSQRLSPPRCTGKGTPGVGVGVGVKVYRVPAKFNAGGNPAMD